MPRAFIDPTPKGEQLASGGSDSLPVVVPANENLLMPFNPTSDSPWLTIAGTTNGVVSFSLSAGTNRVGHVNLLGQSIPVIQPTYVLGTTNVVEGPSANYDSVTLTVTSVAPWTSTANASWLHTYSPSGSGSAIVIFSFDQNTGATRTGTLTIAGQTLTVTQAGAKYVQVTGLPAPPSGVTAFITNNLHGAYGIAQDSAGNIFIADDTANDIKKWSPLTGQVTSVVSGFNVPVAVVRTV